MEINKYCNEKKKKNGIGLRTRESFASATTMPSHPHK